MVATDVAARGLDIPDVEYVINYSFPLTIGEFSPALAVPPFVFLCSLMEAYVSDVQRGGGGAAGNCCMHCILFWANVAAHVGSSGVPLPFDASGVRCCRRLW